MKRGSEVQEPAQTDPVCGMSVGKDSPLRHEHERNTYYFCNPSCLNRFKQDPKAFTGSTGRQDGPPGAEYTCPMHPEIRQDHPGD